MSVSLSEEDRVLSAGDRRHKKRKWQGELKMLRATVTRLEKAQQKKSLVPGSYVGGAPPTYTTQVLEAGQRTIECLPVVCGLEPSDVNTEESVGIQFSE